MTIASMAQWLSGPVTYTTPASTRFYYEPGRALINGTIYLLDAYSDPYQGKNTLQPDTYIAYGVNFFGNLVSVNQNIVAGMNTMPAPQAVPAYDLNYGSIDFFGSTTGADFAEYYGTENNDVNHTVTFNTFTVDTSGATPVVDTGPSITVIPVGKTLTDNVTAELATLTNNNTFNNVLFEVAGEPTPGTINGTFDIIGATGNLVATGTGFSFSDNKAHDFVIGTWNPSNYAQLVEVWNGGTGFADLQLSTINPTTGAVTPGWTALTEMESITRISYSFFSGAGAGMLMVVDGTDQTGNRGFVEEIVNDTSTSSPGGTIYESLPVYYTGTVTQDAIVQSTGQGNNQYYIWWVDGNGLTVELVQATNNNTVAGASLTVLETYNVAQANGTAHVQQLGDGRLFVTYRVQTSTNSVLDYTILDTRLTGQTFTETSGTNRVAGTPEDDTFNLNGGTNTVDGGAGWNKASFNITSAQATITQNADGSWNVVTPGGTDTLSNIQVASFTDRTISLRQPNIDDFSDSRTSDILFRNYTSGDTGFYQMSNGSNIGWQDVGGSSTAYAIVGSGDFAGTGTDDILFRNNTTGDTGFYQMSHGILSGWQDIGGSSTAYSVVGTGDFYGNGTDDVLFRNNTTGDTGFYQMSNGVNLGWQDIGGSSAAYSVVGVGDFNGDGTADVLFRNNTTGDTGFYQIVNGVNTGWHDIGGSSTAYSVVGVGDFNGDGTSDILFRNHSTGDIGFYQINNGVNTGWHDIGASSTAYFVVGIGDYFGNGTSDILFRSNTGDTGFYAMSNGVNTGWHDLGPSSTAYTVASDRNP
jgi:hypothetical protein